MQGKWYKSSLDCGTIEYYGTIRQNAFGSEETITIQYVVFSRYNVKAGVRENVQIHWSEVFKWADADECGGLNVSEVIWSNGTRTYASGLYFGTGHPDKYTAENSGLYAIVSGCYGDIRLRREKRPMRNEHGFAIRG